MKLFRLLGKRALRVFAIVLMVGAIFGFGHFMTPNVNDAWARVVLEGVGSALVEEGVPEHMKMRVDEGTVQEVELNGNRLFYSLYRTDKDVTTLLDYYENLYGSKDRDMVPNDAAMQHVLSQYPKEDRARIRAQFEVIENVADTRHVRVEQPGWGAFATVMTGREGEADWTRDMVDRFRAFKKTGKVGDLGKPKIVVAFEDPGLGGTQYFTVWPDSEFDQRNIRPRNGEDAPGYDIEDIERPLHSTRMVTFGQEHGGVTYEIIVYRSPGTIGSLEEHWIAAMQADGWAISDTFAAAKERQDDPTPAVLFSKDDREAYVSLNRSGDDISSTIIVHSKG